MLRFAAARLPVEQFLHIDPAGARWRTGRMAASGCGSGAGNVVPFLLLSYGEQSVNASVAGVLAAAALPDERVVVAVGVLGEPVTWNPLAGTAAIVSGMFHAEDRLAGSRWGGPSRHPGLEGREP
jgi:drug/metabolite transporter (DMT)-like permease